MTLLCVRSRPALTLALALAMALALSGCGGAPGLLPSTPPLPGPAPALAQPPAPLPIPAPAPPLPRPALGTAPGAPFLALLRAGAPGCIATGSAVHLGRGAFVTAAHLVDGSQAVLRHCAEASASPRLRLDGQEQPARLLRLGQADWGGSLPGTFYRGGQDAALLQAPALAGAPSLPLCAAGPVPGQPVRLVTALRDMPAEIAGLMREADPRHGGYAELALRMEPGESGGAVLASGPAGECLLGLVSHREDAASGLSRTRIVPADTLRGFVGRLP
ncbi:trypsin-like peptidase domain-containing protein [Pseudoroseomonas cervicalis]|uniref:trypsin-like peptidase domain-containing protein n=1 Tax=Teichococcus cervicalis TaxID=204525 RepID=UPI002786E57D|nr:trypsin-like peptidase domain-containing protein [Pseudoroseomonas cervicalis]MDQ1080529.1 hypothetical protein [Pseudoroseomonas cervicalis]